MYSEAVVLEAQHPRRTTLTAKLSLRLEQVQPIREIEITN